MNDVPQLTDAELRAVRAMIRHGATWPKIPHSTDVRNTSGNEMRDACVVALPAPASEPEIVVDITSGSRAAIRRGILYWSDGDWSIFRSSYAIADAEIIADVLRAREKAAKRPRIEAKKPPRCGWVVLCGDMWYSEHQGKWRKDLNPEFGDSLTEPEARALAAKLEADGNYPPGVEVSK